MAIIIQIIYILVGVDFSNLMYWIVYLVAVWLDLLLTAHYYRWFHYKFCLINQSQDRLFHIIILGLIDPFISALLLPHCLDQFVDWTARKRPAILLKTLIDLIVLYAGYMTSIEVRTFFHFICHHYHHHRIVHFCLWSELYLLTVSNSYINSTSSFYPSVANDKN